MATQLEIAAHLDMSERQVRDVLQKLKLDHKATSIDDIRTAYIRALRETAAGRKMSSSRERRDEAQARESEVNAELKARELYKQDALLLDTESVHAAMADWAAVGKAEFTATCERIVTSIESEHGITVERADIQPAIDAALRAVGSYSIKPRDTD